MKWREHTKNTLVGLLAFGTIISAVLGGNWLRANDMQWIVEVPFIIAVVLLGAWFVGYMIRLFMEGFISEKEKIDEGERTD